MIGNPRHTGPARGRGIWRAFPLLALRASVVALSLCGVSLQAGPQDETPLSDSDRDHWAFHPLRRPTPHVSPGSSPRNAIDRFVDHELTERGLVPLPRANRETLVRRMFLDLVGRPPTPSQARRFLDDASPDAVERLVDRLLASPEYGERWGQHWLDLARFAETDGFEHDKTRPEAWRYRDWVIDALNRDMPYDRFVQMQLAGDEMFADDPSARIATSFCLSGPDMPDINSMDERRHNVLNELTGTVSSVLLALQLECAQCHDHKYDPISQADFYRLRAIFDSAVVLKQNVPLSVFVPGRGPSPAHLMIRGDWRRPGPQLEPAFPRIANPWNEGLSAAAVESGSGRRTALARWITRPDHPLTTRVIVNRVWQHHFGHGLSRSPSDFGVMGFSPDNPELMDWLATELAARNWSLKDLHRLTMTSNTYLRASRPDNSIAPEDPAVRQRWVESLDRDKANLRLSRFPIRRLEGEAIRDSMLSVASMLSSRRGGLGVMPKLPDELIATLLKNQWKTSDDVEDHYRRSIYVFSRRNLRYPIFEAFDRPDANASCPSRNRSTTAPQSLLLLNSDFSLDVARRLAGSMLTEPAGDSGSLIDHLFQCIFVRSPTAGERESLVAFVDSQQQVIVEMGQPAEQLATPIPQPAGMPAERAAAIVDLCLALLNCSEFLYVE